MGQYRFSMYLNWQIGLMITYSGHSIDILIPFMSMHVATTKHAYGFDIFNLWLSKN